MNSYKNYNNTNKNKNKNNTSNTFVPQPYCKVCHDAGLTEDIYTSHFIRKSKEPNSPVVCPTLLSQNCRYCLQPGHTVKYCPVLLQKHNTPLSQPPKKVKETLKTKQTSLPSQTPTNMFNVFILYSDDEEEEEKQQQQQQQQQQTIPTKLHQTKTKTQSQTKLKEDFPILYSTNSTYSTKKEMEQKEMTSKFTYAQAILSSSTTSTTSTTSTKIPRYYPLKYSSNWADAESSDDEL